MKQVGLTAPPGAAARVGLSACLAGHPVRYDGRDEHRRWITEVLAQQVELVAVCPEVELGMPVPREPIQLERHAGRTRLVAVESRRDWTAAMDELGRARIAGLIAGGLDGYIFKSRSPSCGVDSVKVLIDGRFERSGTGRFAAALCAARPDLPMIEEPALERAGVREAFVAEVLDHARRRREGQT